MKRKSLSIFCFAGLVLIVGTCAFPVVCFAARTNEIETNYYYCEEDDESLAECDWLGMRFFPCEGTSWTDGDTDDPSINYSVSAVQSCGGGDGQTSCFVKGFSGEPVPISCFRWPWFPWPIDP